MLEAMFEIEVVFAVTDDVVVDFDFEDVEDGDDVVVVEVVSVDFDDTGDVEVVFVVFDVGSETYESL